MASGKSAFDAKQALRDLGISDKRADELGITLFQVSMPFPLDAETVRDFADGLEEVFIVEEKRRVVETQVKDALYALRFQTSACHWPDRRAGQRPRSW